MSGFATATCFVACSSVLLARALRPDWSAAKETAVDASSDR